MRVSWHLEPWQEVKRRHLIGAACFFLLVLALYFGGSPRWTGLFDDANLAFHEAGHPIYGMFGNTLALYGGVLGQLTFPLVIAITFFFRREAIGTAIGGLWFFQNFQHIGYYMADARAQELPLVGGGVHDFWRIFTRWNCLESDVLIGTRVRQAGWIGMVVVLAWLGYRYWRQRSEAARLAAEWR